MSEDEQADLLLKDSNVKKTLKELGGDEKENAKLAAMGYATYCKEDGNGDKTLKEIDDQIGEELGN